METCDVFEADFFDQVEGSSRLQDYFCELLR